MTSGPDKAEQPSADAAHAERDLPQLVAIDDSKLIHRLLRARLKHEHLEIHCASNGEEGLELVRAVMPEVILLDIDTPGMNGFEVLRHLKNDSELNDIPVIFVSGTCEVSRIIEGLDAGAHDFVPKPFEPAELRARVRAAVRLGSMIKMLAQRAQLDGLTGLWNRSYFDTRIDSEFNEARRHGSDLSMVFCDLDHFLSKVAFVASFHGQTASSFADVTKDWCVPDLHRSHKACGYRGGECQHICVGQMITDNQVVLIRIDLAFPFHLNSKNLQPQGPVGRNHFVSGTDQAPFFSDQ